MSSGLQNARVNVILGAFDTCLRRCCYLPSVVRLKYQVMACITTGDTLPEGINASNYVSFNLAKCPAVLGTGCIFSSFNLILPQLYWTICAWGVSWKKAIGRG